MVRRNTLLHVLEEKMKKNKTKKDLRVEQKRLVKWLRVIIVLCIAIIVIEAGYIGISYYNRTKSIVYTDTLNSFKETKDGYLVAGNSDFMISILVDGTCISLLPPIAITGHWTVAMSARGE